MLPPYFFNFLSSLGLFPDFHNLFFMFINELIYNLNGLCFGFTFYYSIFDGYRKLSLATPNMYMRRIVIESLDVYQNTLLNEN